MEEKYAKQVFRGKERYRKGERGYVSVLLGKNVFSHRKV